MISEVTKIIKKASNLLIFSHENPDGDALGSSLGLMHLLKPYKKDIRVYNKGPFERKLAFLPGIEMVVDDLIYVEKNIDLVILLDCYDFLRVSKKAFELSKKIKNVLVIDHHKQQENIIVDSRCWIDSSYASTSQMLVDLAFKSGLSINSDAATCFFTGLQTDTGSFRYSNVTFDVFKVAAILLKLGADLRLINQNLNRVNIKDYDVLNFILKRLTFFFDKFVAIGWITLEEMENRGISNHNLKGVVEVIRDIPEVQVAVFLQEKGETSTKVSLRSEGDVDVAKLSSLLGGGGHKNAAGILFKDPMDVVQKVLIENISRCFGLL